MDAPRQPVLMIKKSLVSPVSNAKLLITREAVPALVTVTDCTAPVVPVTVSVNVSSLGTKAMLGAVLAPTPCKGTRSGELVAVPVMTSVPVRGSVAPGVNLIPMLQLLPG